MTDRPENPIRPTPAAIKLAERYGLSPEAMEAIISGTNGEYPTVTSPAAPALPIPDSPLPVIEQAAQIAEAHAIPPTVAPIVTVPEAETSSVKPNEKSTSGPATVNRAPAKPVTAKPPQKSSSAGLVTAVFTVIAIGIAIALSFQHGCFRQRAERRGPAPVDTIQNMLNDAARRASTPPVVPTQTAPGQVPPEALTVPREEPPGTSGKNSTSATGTTSPSKSTHKVTRASKRPVLETSSNLDAQERLAELRANGNQKARIKTVHRTGGTLYQVQSK